MSAADYMSLCRIPLGLLFIVVTLGHRPWIALGVLVLAGLSDVLDGWLARRQRPPADHEPHRGDWLDPLCDKLFVASVAGGLLFTGQAPLGILVLLTTRELLQAVAVTVQRLSRTLHRASRRYDYKAHPVGKATTVVQFAAAAALVMGHPVGVYAAGLAAGLGVVAVAIYVNRIRAALPDPAPARDPQVTSPTGR